mmetsp:Transcript_9745/g.39904  ORF Transcript_9745/g.39904 Transcript_9745/m.39904 type:complete len:357 (-) Transcript_9745:532-1602(-)
MSESRPSSQHGHRHPTLAARPSHPTRARPQSTTTSHANVNAVLRHSKHIHVFHQASSETFQNAPRHAPTPRRTPSSSAIWMHTEHPMTARQEAYLAALSKCRVGESLAELETWPLGLAFVLAACLACATHCHSLIQNGSATAMGLASSELALPKPAHCSPCFPTPPPGVRDARHDDVTNRHAVNSPCHSISPADVRASATSTCARSTGDRSDHHGELCVITESATEATSSLSGSFPCLFVSSVSPSPPPASRRSRTLPWRRIAASLASPSVVVFVAKGPNAGKQNANPRHSHRTLRNARLARCAGSGHGSTSSDATATHAKNSMTTGEPSKRLPTAPAHVFSDPAPSLDSSQHSPE